MSQFNSTDSCSSSTQEPAEFIPAGFYDPELTTTENESLLAQEYGRYVECLGSGW